MTLSVIAGGGAVYAIIEGGDFSTAFIGVSLLLTFGYLILAVLQHFNAFRKLALALFVITNGLILIMPTMLLYDVMALGSDSTSSLIKELIARLLLSALIFSAAFLIPLWVNWSRKTQPHPDTFS